MENNSVCLCRSLLFSIIIIFTLCLLFFSVLADVYLTCELQKCVCVNFVSLAFKVQALVLLLLRELQRMRLSKIALMSSRNVSKLADAKAQR